MVARLEQQGTKYYLQLDREVVERLGLSVGQAVDVTADGRLRIGDASPANGEGVKGPSAQVNDEGGPPSTPERDAWLDEAFSEMDRRYGRMMKRLAQ